MNIFLVALLIVAGMAGAALIAVHFGFRAPRVIEQKNPGDYGVEYETVKIRTVNGQRLHGWLLSVANSTTTIVVMHGWGGNAEMILPLALPFHRSGFELLLFDARNHGLSPSDKFSSLPKFAEDAGAAVDWLQARRRNPSHKIVLLGHSVGASAVLLTASWRNDIAAVISVAAFAHPDILMRRSLSGLPLPEFMVRGILTYVQWRIGHSLNDIAPMNTLCRITSPVLLIHGSGDRVVPISDLELINGNCGADHAQTLIVDGADHDSIDKIEEHLNEIIGFMKRNGITNE